MLQYSAHFIVPVIAPLGELPNVWFKTWNLVILKNIFTIHHELSNRFPRKHIKIGGYWHFKTPLREQCTVVVK